MYVTNHNSLQSYVIRFFSQIDDQLVGRLKNLRGRHRRYRRIKGFFQSLQQSRKAKRESN